MEERFEELEERFEPEGKSTKHQDVTSEKDNDTTKQSSLKKFLAERDDKLKTPEQKVAAEEASLKMTSLEEDLSAKQSEVEELKTALAATEKAASHKVDADMAAAEKAGLQAQLTSLEEDL